MTRRQDVIAKFDAFLQRAGDGAPLAQMGNVELPAPESKPFPSVAEDEGVPSPDSDADTRPPQVSVSPHTIAMRIMRRDNYLIALMNKQAINLTITVRACHVPWGT